MAVDEHIGVFPLMAHAPDPGFVVGGACGRGKHMPGVVGSPFHPGADVRKKKGLGSMTVPGEFVGKF